jgi:hypothetical protein
VRLGQFRLGVCFWCDWRDLRSFGLTFFALEARSESLSVGLLGFGIDVWWWRAPKDPKPVGLCQSCGGE